ncbi:ESPR-type extended signal peptide-containing protein [Dialister invisus]|uniref:ESPR-type extended signal peptide-containing protein n=1 Tax=Dialister invisus TaxID=218538 RepID=UPI003AAF898D
MNHIYKVIWSRVKNSYVVVSEIAGTAKKSGGVRISTNALAAALTAFLLTSSVAGAVDNVIVGNTEAPNAVTDTTDSTVVGIENKVSKEKDDVIVGKKNTIEDSEDVRVVGKGNTVTSSDRQNVIGDNNSITNRDAGTVSGYHGITRNGTSDLVIGRGNKIEGNDTYMKGYESLTVIGNNNETVNPTSGIVIGDNQTFGTIKESVIIGSMTPEEKASGKREQGGGSVVVGYNAQSGRGLNVAVGHSALALGHEGTVTGHNSVIEANQGSFPNIWSSIYGVNNKITSNGNTSNGIAGNIIGAWNKLDNADNSMIFGSGNILSHATVDMSSGLEGTFGQGAMTELLFRSGYQEGYSDQAAKVMGNFANTSGSVLIAGNGNRSDYARRSQIVGTGNILNGTANGTSANNTMAGFQNTGTNVNRVAVVGTGNKISDGTSDVVIGDYHEMSGGTNNVILGAMATKEDVVSKTYTPSLGSSSGAPGGYTGIPIPYNVRATVPTKTHTANVSNAVMLGYNTDVQKNGGVALGSESVSSVDAGVYGYSPDTNQNIQNDTEIANLTGKTARLAQLNGDLPGLSSAYTAKKADYEGKVNDFLAKSAAYTQAYQTYHSYEHSGDQYDLARKKEMDDAKTVMDTAQTAMNAAKTDYTDAETKYNSALGERNLIIGTWKATAAAVSVGDVSRGITRQITGVAAGTQDTDAVNVAQLKTAKTHYYSVEDKGYHAGNYNNDGAKGGMALAAGAGAAANGTASTVTGAFSRVDGNGINGFKSGFQGATSSVYGTFNVVGAKNGVDFDGVANSIIGVANKTENANASLIFGAGNKVTNSYRPVNAFTAAPLANALQTAIQQGNTDEMIEALGALVKDSGGAVLAIGGANMADYAQLSKLVGVGNKLTGTENKPSAYNMIDGYLNTGKNINHVSVIGSENEVEDTDDALVFGNKRKLSGAGGSIILGSGDRTITTNVSDAVSIGHNANVEKAGGVALGSWSVANTDRGVAGYDPAGGDHANDTTGTWKATAAAVSVGKAADPTGAAGSSAITRQITNVAAGTQDTDAVNVAQLKAVQTAADASKVHFFSVKGNSSDENYNNDGAIGDRALAVGVAAKAGGLKATALTGGNASGDFSFAVGNNAQAKGWGSVAIGAGTLAEKQGTVAIGHGAKAYSLESVALGYNTQAGAPSGQPGAGNHAQTAMGSGTIATGGAATAFGFESVASGAHAIAGGNKAKATGQDSVALGKDTKASGTWSVALGSDTKAEGQSSTALGTDTTASGIASTAMGSNTTAAGNWSLASGGLSEAKGDYSTAMGYNSKANARNSFAVSGGIVEDAAKNSIAMGEGAKATVSDAVALGSGSVASTEKGKIGYDISGDDHSNDTTGVWKSTANAVSVGDASKGITRQITGVAAGTQDTDAVNVAQLKKAVAGAADGNDTLVSDSNALSLSGKTLSMSVKDTAGNEVKGSVDLSAIAGQIDTNTTYTMSGTQNADNTTTITLKGSDGKENKVTVATKDTRNTVKAGENVTLDTIANTFGGTEYTVNVKADGKVENGSTKIVSGNTVYHETRVKNDGNYVKKENSAGDNLTILDKQVGKNTTNITNLGNTINNLNGKLGNLDNRISKVGAGAAALAALHPLDFDPHDKWDIAAGFGNYRNASAAAVGLFYRPNERTMMSLGWTMGDDRNMINAGVSVKLGRGDVYTRYSKVEMANQIKDLKEKNDKMQAENKEMRSELDELKAQVAALAAKK